MFRRRFLGILSGLIGGAGLGSVARSAPGATAAPRLQDGFPLPLVTVPGAQALQAWERLRAEGRGWPVIVGDDESLEIIAAGFAMTAAAGLAEAGNQTPNAILAAADKIDVPHELKRIFDEEYGDDPMVVDVGDWPAAGKAERMTLTVATDLLTGRALDRVHIAIVPTDDPTAAPAYLRWGGWNACPRAEVHVAVLRRWQERYGAELVGLTGDVMNLRVKRRPASREEALDLAREQFLYCSDLVWQGTEELAPLAATLMESDWWYFWWD